MRELADVGEELDVVDDVDDAPRHHARLRQRADGAPVRGVVGQRRDSRPPGGPQPVLHQARGAEHDVTAAEADREPLAVPGHHAGRRHERVERQRVDAMAHEIPRLHPHLRRVLRQDRLDLVGPARLDGVQRLEAGDPDGPGQRRHAVHLRSQVAAHLVDRGPVVEQELVDLRSQHRVGLAEGPQEARHAVELEVHAAVGDRVGAHE